MKRRDLVGLVLAATLALAGPASAITIGAGVFGGASIPVVQEDTGTGSQFGVRVPINIIPLLTVEPYYAYAGGGDVSETFRNYDYTRSGFDSSSFGVNLALGDMGLLPGFALYPYAGIGTTSLSRTGSEDISEVNYNFGLGLGFPVAAGFSLHVRGELCLVATGETSRKFGNVNAGVQYKFFGTP